MSLPEEILETIKDLGEVSLAILYNKWPKSISNMHVPPGFYVSTDRMVRRHLLKKRKVNNRVLYQITSRGKCLLQKRLILKKRNDEFLTVILFDIPESKHVYRNRLRRFLIQHKFTLMQKSVLIGPYLISTEFGALLKEWRLDQFVKILIAKR